MWNESKYIKKTGRYVFYSSNFKLVTDITGTTNSLRYTFT